MTVTDRPAPEIPRSHPLDRGFVAGLPQRDRCLVMGIVNVTPDSFSDGGAYLEADRAVRHGIELFRLGADIIDVGGESTRPGAGRISQAEELRRVLPVVRGLANAGVTVSIDTMRARVASAAVDAGAIAVNDVSGGLADTAMATQVAEAQVPFIAMHWRGRSRDMQDHANYGDVVADVIAELDHRMDSLVDAGIQFERILLDPGIGFAKNAAHNWELLARLGELQTLGRPILVGASRKSFLGTLLGTDEPPTPPQSRDAASAAISALAAASGAYCVRVHEVPATLDAVRVAAAWTTPPSSPIQRDGGG